MTECPTCKLSMESHSTEELMECCMKQVGEEFTEVYVKTSIDTLIKRDTKGFYKKALEKKMENLTGVNSDFEEPRFSPIVINTDKTKVEEAVKLILNNEKYDFEKFPEITAPIDGLVYFPGTINLKPFARLTQAEFLNDIQIKKV